MTSAIEPHSPSLQDRWRLCKEQDDQKASLIADLFNHIGEITGRLSEVELELREKKMVVKSMWDTINDGRERVGQKDKHCFALVLVDGDCMPFLDDLVEQGLEGGKKASSFLEQAVASELRSVDRSLPHHLRVVVRVFANLKGLAATYAETGTIRDPGVFCEFVRGFNMTSAMCDFVDAGNGKECADEKLKANFRFSVDDVHCRHILFGASADSGYMRLLGSYLETEEVREKVILVEGPPFAQELAEIRHRFRIASFNKVFRRQKLVNLKRKVATTGYYYNYVTPPPTPSSADYASAAAKPASSAPAHTARRSSPSANAASPILGDVVRNKAGQRVDPPLSYAPQDFNAMKSRRLCNSFHLAGRCYHKETRGSCSHEHGQSLTLKELQALVAVARRSHCHSGLDCNDPNCVYGHQCPREDCDGASCRYKFPLELHNIDKKVVR
ncbi:hypothetical protein CTA2_6440 [Colletotrichum tanaceti]|uniref:C3H1-type domain-containing protein n=1 Tax=Colletotrichum tanaceti TaxID=1306861 RepID=A0A4U6XTH8_9PEZI|nr:hypothetical protein CTA2_6440 [Colletotrichum tanaceti]TKW59178.1 hypothetical protein CTA1_853 [Colletotrichum tanaceti]